MTVNQVFQVDAAASLNSISAGKRYALRVILAPVPEDHVRAKKIQLGSHLKAFVGLIKYGQRQTGAVLAKKQPAHQDSNSIVKLAVVKDQDVATFKYGLLLNVLVSVNLEDTGTTKWILVPKLTAESVISSARRKQNVSQTRTTEAVTKVCPGLSIRCAASATEELSTIGI